jgi:hypothetical protein
VCVAVGTASHQLELEARSVHGDPTVCVAVGTASHQLELEACSVHGDPIVCSRRHSKSSA